MFDATSQMYPKVVTQLWFYNSRAIRAFVIRSVGKYTRATLKSGYEGLEAFYAKPA